MRSVYDGCFQERELSCTNCIIITIVDLEYLASEKYAEIC